MKSHEGVIADSNCCLPNYTLKRRIGRRNEKINLLTELSCRLVAVLIILKKKDPRIAIVEQYSSCHAVTDEATFVMILPFTVVVTRSALCVHQLLTLYVLAGEITIEDHHPLLWERSQ
jgi:hypothetical protein